MSISLLSTGIPGLILNWKNISLNNYNFTNIDSFSGWSPSGGTIATNEGIGGSKCAKLPNQYDGLYRYVNLTANKLHRIEAIIKPVTTGTVQITVSNNDGSVEYVNKEISNSSNYNLYTLEFKANINAIRIGFEVYPSSGSMFVNEMKLFSK